MVSFILGLFIYWPLAFGAVSTSDRALVERGDNLLRNGGFESGRAQWTASAGTFATTTTAANVGKGSVAATWDAAASGNTLTSSAVAIPAGLYGRNGVASCLIQGASATHTLQAFDGTNILASQTISSQSGYTRTSVNFIFPSSGNISLRLYANADEPSVAIDDCYLGEADGYNISQISQAEVVGSIQWSTTTNCSWERTNASYGAFADDNDCDDNARTVTGSVTDSSNGVRPEFGITNAKTGEYLVVVSGAIFASSTGAATDSYAYFQLHDGTSAVGSDVVVRNAGASGIVSTGVPTMSYSFSITSSGNKTIAIQAKTSGGAPSARIRPADSAFKITVYRFPSASEIAYRPELVNTQGYVRYNGASSCTWSQSNGSFSDFPTDSDCSSKEFSGTASDVGNSQPEAYFNRLKAGTYRVEATGLFVTTYSGSNTECIYRLYDGTNQIATIASTATSGTQNAYISGLSGPVKYTSFQSQLRIRVQAIRTSGGGSCVISNSGAVTTFSISLVPIDQNTPAPLLVGSVTSNSSGQERIERAQATSICSSSPCTLQSSSGGVTSVTRSGTGAYAINFASGTFSTPPTCVCISTNTSSAGNGTCVWDGTAPTTTQFGFRNYVAHANSAGDAQFSIICMGPR